MGSQAAHDAPMRVIRQPKAARDARSAGGEVRGRGVRAAADPTIGGRYPKGPRPLAGSVGAPSGAEIGHRCRPNEQTHWPQANSNAGNRKEALGPSITQTALAARSISAPARRDHPRLPLPLPPALSRRFHRGSPLSELGPSDQPACTRLRRAPWRGHLLWL